MEAFIKKFQIKLFFRVHTCGVNNLLRPQYNLFGFAQMVLEIYLTKKKNPQKHNTIQIRKPEEMRMSETK